jgi:SAM-dependent methyltransferase
VRYIEFDFFWEVARHLSPRFAYLDVSSPRLFPLQLVAKGRTSRASFLNPDRADIGITQTIAGAMGIDGLCEFHECLISDLSGEGPSFDYITSISVVEHIPDDTAAIAKMWQLLNKGGRLGISVPVAASGFDQYRDFDEYGLLGAEADGTVFFQRFYDERSLRDRIFLVTGMPDSFSLYGERSPGLIQANANAKLSDPSYPFWREPYMMASDYHRFDRVADLPGQGVIAMEFVKK